MNILFEKDGIVFIDNDVQQSFTAEIKKIYELVEEQFGPIDKTYITTINFNSAGRIVTEVFEEPKLIRINLPIYEMSDSCEDTKYQRNLNLSHELIHTITPCSDSNKATFLDEGLATVFSERYTGCDSNPPEKYIKARSLVQELFNQDDQTIKKVHTKYPQIKISDYTIEMIKDVSPSIDIHLLQKLTKRFNEE